MSTSLVAVPDGNVPAQREDNDAVLREDGDIPYFGRAAICFMTVAEVGDDAALYERLMNTFKDDSRVESVQGPEPDNQTFFRPAISSFGSFKDDTSVRADEAPDPYSHLHAFNFRWPMLLHVRSPRRLQPQYSTFKEIPAESYWAAWDGITLVVLWESEEDLKDIDWDEAGLADVYKVLSPSGGLLVQEILKDAVEKCGYEFRTVPCSPVCDYSFAHSDLVVHTIGEDQETRFHDDERGLVRVDLGSDHELRRAVVELDLALGFLGGIFARMRSEGATMESAAWRAQADVTKLLQLDYERAALGAKPVLKSLGERWKSRKWRRSARQFVAFISLDLVTLEHARSDWARHRQLYEDSAQNRNAGVVFEHEHGLGVSAVSTLEVGEARSAIERVTASLDTRALVLATALGAVFGALIGAVIGHFV
jgi:hypothetical protein